jgi:hypothetical protein
MLATRTIVRPVTDRAAAFAALTDRHLDAAIGWQQSFSVTPSRPRMQCTTPL